MENVPKKPRAKRGMSRAKKLASLRQFSKKPADTLKEQCPTKLRITFSVYHWEKQTYLPLSAASFSKVFVRNAREFARLRKLFQDIVDNGVYMDEKNEQKPDPPSLEKQLDPALHRNLDSPLDGH